MRSIRNFIRSQLERRKEQDIIFTSTLVKRLSSSIASGIGCLGVLRTLPLRVWWGPPRLPGWHEWWGTTPALIPPTNTWRTPPSPSLSRLCTIPIFFFLVFFCSVPTKQTVDSRCSRRLCYTTMSNGTEWYAYDDDHWGVWHRQPTYTRSDEKRQHGTRRCILLFAQSLTRWLRIT